MAASTTLTPLQLVIPAGVTSSTSVISIDASVLPFIIDADLNTTRIEIGIYNNTTAINSFSLVGTNNQFTTSIPLQPSITETNVTIVGRNYDPTFNWQPGTAYVLGQRFADPNANVQVVVQANGTGTLPRQAVRLLPHASSAMC